MPIEFCCPRGSVPEALPAYKLSDRTCVSWFDRMPAELHFPPCRTCVSPFVGMPADDRMPPGMHFPPRRTCLSWFDQMPLLYTTVFSGVAKTCRMFLNNSAFNQPIGDCDTSSVANMDRMFRYNDSFNQQIGNWDTSQVTNMGDMLHNSGFNQPIGYWDTSSVTNMDAMFRDRNAFNQPVSDWDTSSVTNIQSIGIRPKPMCSPQRPAGKPAHRPCIAQGPTADVVPCPPVEGVPRPVGFMGDLAGIDMPAFALSGLGVAGPHVGINSNDSDNNSNDNSVFVHASPPSTLLGGTSGLTAGPLPTIPDFPFASGADTPSRCRPPYCDWTSWAGGFSVGAKAVFGETVRISSMFSGIGTESCATAILGRHYGTAPGLNPTFHHTCAFETRKAARDVLVAGSHGAVFGDIFGLLPLALRSWIDNGSHTFGSLQARIIEARPVVSRKAFCYRAETEVEVLLGDIVVCGIPCVDFSPMGMQRGLGGPTGALVCAWVRIILEYLPAVILIEEVPGFVKHGLSYLGSKGGIILSTTHCLIHVASDSPSAVRECIVLVVSGVGASSRSLSTPCFRVCPASKVQPEAVWISSTCRARLTSLPQRKIDD